MKNPKIDEACFGKLLKKLKIEVADTRGVFKAANTSRSGLLSFHEFLSVYATLKNPDQPPEDKVDLVFRCFDRDQKGQLDEGEVQQLLETGLETALEPMPARTPDTKMMLKKKQVEDLLGAMTFKGNHAAPLAPVGTVPPKKKVGRMQLRSVLKNDNLYEAIAPGAGILPGVGISADQLLEATVMKSSKLCVIL